MTNSTSSWTSCSTWILLVILKMSARPTDPYLPTYILAFFGVNSSSQIEPSREQCGNQEGTRKSELRFGRRRRIKRMERKKRARAERGRKKEGDRGLENALVSKAFDLVIRIWV